MSNDQSDMPEDKECQIFFDRNTKAAEILIDTVIGIEEGKGVILNIGKLSETYVRRSLVDELKATIKSQAAEIAACKMIMSATADEIIRLEALVKSQEDK